LSILTPGKKLPK
jgi:N-acetylneuraminic acid mutarotase